MVNGQRAVSNQERMANSHIIQGRSISSYEKRH